VDCSSGPEMPTRPRISFPDVQILAATLAAAYAE
jgi:hypothetical protein